MEPIFFVFLLLSSLGLCCVWCLFVIYLIWWAERRLKYCHQPTESELLMWNWLVGACQVHFGHINAVSISLHSARILNMDLKGPAENAQNASFAFVHTFTCIPYANNLSVRVVQ